MKRFIALLLTLPLFGAEPLATAFYHPVRLPFYAMLPFTPTPHEDIQLLFAESNEFENEEIFLADMEMTTLRMVYEHPIDTASSIRISIPLHAVWGGFMDGALDWFHDATGLLNGAEHNIYGKNEVHYRIGTLFTKNSSYSFVGDVTLEYKHTLPWQPFGMDLAAQVGCKLPTAPKYTQMASRKMDLAVALGAQKGDWIADLWIARLGTKRLGSYARSHRFMAGAYLSYSYKHWHFAYRFATAPYESHYSTLNSVANVVDIGYTFANGLTLFATENLAPFYTTMDFTIGVRYNF